MTVSEPCHMTAVENFARDFAAAQASEAYSNSTHPLLPWGLFAMLNQVASHLLVEFLVHGRRACFAAKRDWAYAPEPTFEQAHGCVGARCYIAHDLECAHRPPRATNTTRHDGAVTLTRAERALRR